MAALNFKTRGMTDPKGKPRVYFCCHPEEHEKYFNAYSEELLKLQNCAVWYCGDPKAERDEEFLGSLHEMQLFVMPVTAKLLYTHNPALAVEFSYAVQNHIPVLPIIEESGLVEVFNKKCGDIQFLDRNAEDDTARLYIVRLLNISESLYQKTQEVKYLAAIGMANYNLYLSSAQSQKAEYISKACASMAKASRLCPENENYRRLFKKYADVIIKITQEQQ